MVYAGADNPEALVGKRVTIRAVRQYGTARVLDGLTGIVVAPHPIACDWVKVHLDPNPVTPHKEWAIPRDRLIVDESE